MLVFCALVFFCRVSLWVCAFSLQLHQFMQLSRRSLARLYYATRLQGGEYVPADYYHVKSAEEVFLASAFVLKHKIRIILATRDNCILPGSELCHVVKL